MKFFTSTLERLRIDASGNSLFYGPAYLMGGQKLYFNNPINTASGSIVCPGGGSLALQAYGNDMIYLNENSEIRFSTSSSEKMRINSAGNVGIGTTSPGTLHGVTYGTTKLHIDGGTDRGQMIIEGDSFAGIVLSDNGATANEKVFTTSVDEGKYTIKPLNDNGTSTAGGVAVTVLHGGNVGIGTTTPDQKLQVGGNFIFMMK